MGRFAPHRNTNPSCNCGTDSHPVTTSSLCVNDLYGQIWWEKPERISLSGLGGSTAKLRSQAQSLPHASLSNLALMPWFASNRNPHRWPVSRSILRRWVAPSFYARGAKHVVWRQKRGFTLILVTCCTNFAHNKKHLPACSQLLYLSCRLISRRAPLDFGLKVLYNAQHHVWLAQFNMRALRKTNC